jgi:membrane protein DedA with SNARE-associated domain
VSLLLQETLKEFIVQYGYFAIYVLLALGIVGLPVPDEILMIFVGYLTIVGLLTYWIAIAVSFAGAMTGMTLSYLFGHKVGKPFLVKYGKWVKLTPERLGKAESWFHKYGLWTVFFGYFVPGVRHFTCYLAGASRVKFWRYLLYAGTGALVWCIAFITLGHFLGLSVQAVFYIIHRFVGWGLFTMLMLAGVIALMITGFRKRVRE